MNQLIAFEKTKLTKAIYGLYILLTFKNGNLEYTTINQRRSFKSFLFLDAFFSHIVFFFTMSFFKFSRTKKHHVYNLYHISYILKFCYLMYYIVSEYCFGGHLLEDCFHCYSKQIISASANEFLIPYNLIPNTKSTRDTKALIL